MNNLKRKIMYLSLFILCCCIIILLFFITHRNNVEIVSIEGTVHGEVMGELAINGDIHTNQTLRDVPFLLWNYDSYENAKQYFRLRIWNITTIMIKDDYNGTVSYTNYSMENKELVIVADMVSAYFTCNIRSGLLSINFSRLNAINQDGDFEIYLNYSSLRCEGELNHQTDEYHLDFEMLSRLDVHIDDATFQIHGARFSIPLNQTAKFEIVAIGRGIIKPTPTFTVNGTVQINEFRELSEGGQFKRSIQHLRMRSSNVTIATLIEPYCRVKDHERMIYVTPWRIRIEVHD